MSRKSELGLLMPVRFRLYPNGKSSGLYLVVQVWPSLTSMRRYIGSTYPSRTSYRDTMGMCSAFKVVTYPKGKRSCVRGIFAELNLNAANLTMRIVTHELFHATMAYARRMRIDLAQVTDERGLTTSVSVIEETLSRVHGILCSDFVTRATALRLYDERGEPKPWGPWSKAA